MFVQRVLMPVSEAESWTLLGEDGSVVEPVEQYLAYLTAIERSPNTVRAYAISLKLWFEFLAHVGVDWRCAGPEDVARFVAWLRAPAENVIVLADASAVRAPASINRYLAAVFGFYDHHARAADQPRRIQAVPASRHEGPADPDPAGAAARAAPGAARPGR
jgi:site-specific recombinase XerD